MIAISGTIVLGGCSASKNLMEHSSLQTETKMSSTIFLDPVSFKQKTVLLQVRNTSDRKDFNPKNEIKASLEKAGYTVTEDPEKAHYLLQANILKAGQGRPEEMQQALLGGYGGVIEGVAVGAALSGYSDHSNALLTGGLAGAAVGVMADTLIKNVTYTVITDLQVSERAKIGVQVSENNQAVLKQGTSGYKQVVSQEITDWKRYQTRIISTANKVNLAFKEAEPALLEGLAQSISGVFG